MSEMPRVDMGLLAANYDEKRRMAPGDFERLLARILQYANVGGRVLEVGCGTGFYLAALAECLPESVCCGLEPSEAMLAQARAKVKRAATGNCLLLRADGQSLPFSDDTFDFVLMSQVLHFFGDKPKAAGEVHRVTKAGARLLVITTSHPQLRAQVDLAFFPGIAARDTARIPSTSEIRRLFEGHGFELYSTAEFATTFRADSAEALAEWAGQMPWSSYLLLSREEFKRGLRGFRKRLIDTFGCGEIAYLVPQTLMFFRKV